VVQVIEETSYDITAGLAVVDDSHYRRVIMDKTIGLFVVRWAWMRFHFAPKCRQITAYAWFVADLPRHSNMRRNHHPD
jgi:hypothetical protein